MSFILEALRRADRERKTGTNPDLQTVVELTHVPQPRPRWPWLALAGAVLFGGLALALLLWPRTTTEVRKQSVAVSTAPVTSQQPPRVAPTVAPESPPRDIPDAPSMTRAQAATSPVVPAAPPDALAKRYGRDTTVPIRPEARRTIPATGPTDTPPVAAVPTSPPPPSAVTPKTTEHLAVDLETAPTAAVPRAEPSIRPPESRPIEATQRETPGENIPDAALVKHPAQKTDQAVTARQTPPEPPSAIPLVVDLPPTRQQPFAGIQLDAHVYAEDPAERFVLINMRGYRVGDPVGNQGAVLDAITRDGAVLRSGELRALVPHP